MLCAAITLAVSACGGGGGGGTKTIVDEVTTVPQPSTTYSLPSSATPTSCVAYATGHAAEIQFVSASFNVSTACTTWVADGAKQGSLWTTTQPSDASLPDDLQQVCELQSQSGDEYALVLDDGEQTIGQGACTGELSAGWTDWSPPQTSVSPDGSTPAVRFGSWSGQEPTEIGFSADGGNIVTGIIWTSWNASSALGIGTSDLQSCVPNCAAGGEIAQLTLIELSNPDSSGMFATVAEARGGWDHSLNYGAGAEGGWPQEASKSPY